MLSDTERLWLELKVSWKAWFNCVGAPVVSNSAYLSYLQGTNRSHSFRQDFGKMNSGNWSGNDHRAICLIGLDKVGNPMDGEVAAVASPFETGSPAWVRSAERHWPDRRCTDFRVSVWTWYCSPVVATTPAIDSTFVLH